MANTVTTTAAVSFSSSPTVQLLGASSTVVHGSEDQLFIRIIGAADTEDNQLSLSADIYPLLGGRPGWLWVKNIDPVAGRVISIRVDNSDQITTETLEIARLTLGEAALIKIGRSTDENGDLSDFPNDATPADYKIVGGGDTLYDMVVMPYTGADV